MRKIFHLNFLCLLVVSMFLMASPDAMGMQTAQKSGLDILEQGIFGRKFPEAPKELRLEQLENAFQLIPDPRLSESYRMIRLFALQKNAISIQQKSAAARIYNRGVDEAAKGNIDNAIIAYRQAIQADPSFIQAYNNLANLMLQKQQYDETIELYKRGLQINPAEPLLHRNLGILYEKLGKIQEAVAEYSQYMKLSPNPDPPIRAIVENYRLNRKMAAGTPDYLVAAMRSSQGSPLIWPTRTLPVKVYVHLQNPDQNFSMALIRKALNTWENATGKRLLFLLSTRPAEANIVIRLQEGPLSDPVAHIGQAQYEADETQRQRNELSLVSIQLNTGNAETAKLPAESRDEQFYRMTLHELGHAIGIWGHSPDPGDIMFNHPISATLSQRDVTTIRMLYGLPVKPTTAKSAQK